VSIPHGRRIVITGMGAVSPFGIGAASLWQALREGRSGIAPLRHPDAGRLRVRVAAQVPADFDPAAHFDERTIACRSSRCSPRARRSPRAGWISH